jgi:hypothetical protein
MIILWHVDPLLGNDWETSKYTTAVIEQRLLKQTIPWQQLDTTIMGSANILERNIGVFCVVRNEML